MHIIMLFGADPEMPDPARGHPDGVQPYELVPEGSDAFVVWREWGDTFEGGFCDHVIGQGIWENLTPEMINAALAVISGEAEIREVD